jgi:hypothetical protein
MRGRYIATSARHSRADPFAKSRGQRTPGPAPLSNHRNDVNFRGAFSVRYTWTHSHAAATLPSKEDPT